MLDQTITGKLEDKDQKEVEDELDLLLQELEAPISSPSPSQIENPEGEEMEFPKAPSHKLPDIGEEAEAEEGKKSLLVGVFSDGQKLIQKKKLQEQLPPAKRKERIDALQPLPSRVE